MVCKRKVPWLMCYEMGLLLCFVVCYHARNYPNMARLTNDQRNEAIGMLRNSTVNEVAQHFGVHRRTVERLVRKRQDTGAVKDLPRSGRPRVTTVAEDRVIRTIHLRRRFQTAVATLRQWVGGHAISRHTVRRRLKDEGISCKRPIIKEGLQQRHRASRLAWATHHIRWTQQQWQTVVMCDESPFPVTKRDNRQRVYRRRHERLAPNCIKDKGDKRSVHIWGAISWYGKSQLHVIQGNINANRYMNEILEPVLLPLYRRTLSSGQRPAAPCPRHPRLATRPKHRPT